MHIFVSTSTLFFFHLSSENHTTNAVLCWIMEEKLMNVASWCTFFGHTISLFLCIFWLLCIFRYIANSFTNKSLLFVHTQLKCIVKMTRWVFVGKVNFFHMLCLNHSQLVQLHSSDSPLYSYWSRMSLQKENKKPIFFFVLNSFKRWALDS